MKFYRHHLGDYARIAAHLSWDEDCALRRLRDAYVSREAPFPDDEKSVFRICGASRANQKAALSSVLHRYFTPTPNGWICAELDELIAHTNAAAERARTNGTRGGRPRKTQSVSEGKGDDKTHVEPSSNPDGLRAQNRMESYPLPITNTSFPTETTRETQSVTADPKAELWAAGKSLLRDQGMPSARTGAFLGKLARDWGEPALLDALGVAVVERPAEAASYLVATCKARAGQRRDVEPTWRREQRERVRAACPGIAAPEPGAVEFFEGKAINVAARLVGR